jgi:DNA end-binding protein Ku
VVDEAELEKLRPAKDKALALERFLDAGHVDPALFSGRSLYLAPDGPAAHRPYTVLTQALHQHHKWAVGRVVLSGRRHLALVRPVGRVLALHLLHYPAQLRASALVEADVRPEAATPEELELAGLLIEAASQATLCWSEYRDDTAAGLRALVESLAQGQPVVTAPVEEAPVLSLLEALKRSVSEVAGKAPPAETTSLRGRNRKKAPSRRSA